MADNWIHKVRSDTLQKRLFADIEKGIFTDVTFRVGPDGNQRTFKAHQLVLASENSEFENMLHGSQTRKIEIPDVHPKGFENLIRYCYGESFLSKDLPSIRETYLTAKKFKARKLQLIAENNLIDLLKSESLIKILNVCQELNLSRAKERCLEVISSQLEKVLKAEEIISAPLEVMEEILCLCTDRKSESKVSAICTVLDWAKRNECPDNVTRHLLSAIQFEHIPPDVIMTFFRGKDGHLAESSFQVERAFYMKKISQERIKAVRNTASDPVEDTKVESSELGQENLLNENKDFTNEVQSSGYNDKKELIANRQETAKLEDEKRSDIDYDSEDDSVIQKEIINDLIKKATSLITNTMAESSSETVDMIIDAAKEVTKHAVENMQRAIDHMAEASKNLTLCKSRLK